MRSTTKSIVSVVSLGILAASYKFGMESASANSLGASAINSIPQASSSSSATPSTSSSPSPSASATTSTSTTTTRTSASGTHHKATKASTGSKQTSAGSSASGSNNSGSGSSSSGASSSGSSNSGSSSNSSSGSSSSGSSASGSGSTTPAAPSVVTKTSGLFSYWYGEVQVSVTKTDGKITAISLPALTYSRAPYGIENTLISEAIAAQGANIANVSRATYTSQAFIYALKDALAKF